MFLSPSPSPKGPIASVVSDYRSPLYLVKGRSSSTKAEILNKNTKGKTNDAYYHAASDY